MKVLLASQHLAESTLRNKVKVYASKKDVPKQKKSTKAKEVLVVEVEVDGETIREQWTKEQLVEFNQFMKENEARLGITREHFVQAKQDSLTPMKKLMSMLTALGDKAEGVLTINQKLAQEVASKNTDIQRISTANDDIAKENEKLVAKLKELNEKLTDQSAAREIYEKEALALREQLTKKHADAFSARVVEEAERIKGNDKKAHGPVRLYWDDPEWKNWFMLVKACPKCGCSVSPFPERRVGCSQGCKAKDDVESMGPEEWNEWVFSYVPEKSEQDDVGDPLVEKVSVDDGWDVDATEVEIPPAEEVYYTEDAREDDDSESYQLRQRLSHLELQVEQLTEMSVNLARLLEKALDQAETHPLDALIERLGREAKLASDILADVDWADSDSAPARQAMDMVYRWKDALVVVIEAFRDRDVDLDAWLRIDAGLSSL
jgi:hypothetical protein